MCSMDHQKLQKFLKFRESFEGRKRKVEILYNLYKKLRTQISGAINSFGLLIISFVENDFMAPK